VFGDLLVTEVSAPLLLQLRDAMVRRGLSLKTVRNILDASLRAMLRDARTVDQLIDRDPFTGVIWPRMPKRPADPFTEFHRGGARQAFALVPSQRPLLLPVRLFLFHTGSRPSETVALRWGDVDTDQGVATIRLSRYLGSESATKTQHSERTIRLLPIVRDALRDLRPVHATEETYVFVNAKNGGPIEQREWPKDHWRGALTGTGIRPRKFYATKHTFISVALTEGLNLTFIAEYCGTSVAMIEQHYGRFLGSRVDDQLALLSATSVSPRAQRREAKTPTLG
jgi:integrase